MRRWMVVAAVTLAACVALSQVLPTWQPASLSMRYTLTDPSGSVSAMGMAATVEFYSADGQRLGNIDIEDLRAFLTTQEKQQLAAMMTRVRGLAESYYGVGE